MTLKIKQVLNLKKLKKSVELDKKSKVLRMFSNDAIIPSLMKNHWARVAELNKAINQRYALSPRVHKADFESLKQFQDAYTAARLALVGGKVHGYMLNNNPFWFLTMPNEKNPIFMGFEWEIGLKSKSGKLEFGNLTKLSPDILKYLSFGVGGYPIEIRSIPVTLGVHKTLMPEMFFSKDVFNDTIVFKREGGMHVHINKGAFDDTSIDKLHKLFYGSTKFTDMLQDLTKGRFYNSYWCSLKFSRLMLLSDTTSDKGCAINHHDCGTIELRIFAVPQCEEEFFINMEFAEAVTRFVRIVSKEELTLDRFMSFISLRTKRYQYLWDYLKGYRAGVRRKHHD